MKCFSLLLALAVCSSACQSAYPYQQKLCGNYYLVEHESAAGKSLVRCDEKGLDEGMPFSVIEGDIVEAAGNCDYIFVKQENEPSHFSYYKIDVKGWRGFIVDSPNTDKLNFYTTNLFRKGATG